MPQAEGQPSSSGAFSCIVEAKTKRREAAPSRATLGQRAPASAPVTIPDARFSAVGRPRHRRALGSIPGLTPAVVLYARQKSPWTAACPRTEVWTARSTEKKRDSSLCPLIHIFVVGRVCAHCSCPLPGRDVGARWSPAEVKELCFCATWAWTGAKCAPFLTPSWADGTLGILHVVGGRRRYCGTILADAHAKCRLVPSSYLKDLVSRRLREGQVCR